jgi:AAA domain-containing protein
MKNASGQLFSRKLLTKTDQERFGYFRDKKISHELLNQAKAELEEAIASAEQDWLIFAYGPTGVGKSTLGDIVARQIIEARWELLKQDLEWIPAVHVEMPAPPGGTFSWAEGFRSLLRGMGEPLIDFKMAPRKTVEGIEVPAFDRSNTRRYLHAYEKALSHRRPVIVLLDDAHYLGKVPTRRLTNQLDVVKCLAVKTKTPHGLLGTYDLLPLRNLSGQISRRSIDVHFRRYRESDTDVTHFTDAVYTFQANLPVEHCPNLLPYVDYLLEGSVGCVGNLKKWLNKALKLALGEGGKKLTIDHMRKGAWSKAQLSRMFAETLEGEELLSEDGSRYEALRRRMWPDKETAYRSCGEAPEPEKKKPGKKGNRRPGRRSPGRDQIGVGRMPRSVA